METVKKENLKLYQEASESDVRGVMYLFSDNKANNGLISLNISIPKSKDDIKSVFTKIKTPIKIYIPNSDVEKEVLNKLYNEIGKDFSHAGVILINYCDEKFVIPLNDDKITEIFSNMQSVKLDLSKIEPIHTIEWGYEKIRKNIYQFLSDKSVNQIAEKTHEFKI